MFYLLKGDCRVQGLGVCLDVGTSKLWPPIAKIVCHVAHAKNCFSDTACYTEERLLLGDTTVLTLNPKP